MGQSGARSLVVVVGTALSIGAIGCYAADWTYAGATGPAKWGTMDKSFALCKSLEPPGDQQGLARFERARSELARRPCDTSSAPGPGRALLHAPRRS